MPEAGSLPHRIKTSAPARAPDIARASTLGPARRVFVAAAGIAMDNLGELIAEFSDRLYHPRDNARRYYVPIGDMKLTDMLTRHADKGSRRQAESSPDPREFGDSYPCRYPVSRTTQKPPSFNTQLKPPPVPHARGRQFADNVGS